MGELNRHYCDLCGAEMSAVGYRATLSETAATETNTVIMDLCGGCYSKLRGYFGDRKNEAAEQWTAPEAIAVAPDLSKEL